MGGGVGDRVGIGRGKVSSRIEGVGEGGRSSFQGITVRHGLHVYPFDSGSLLPSQVSGNTS